MGTKNIAVRKCVRRGELVRTTVLYGRALQNYHCGFTIYTCICHNTSIFFGRGNVSVVSVVYDFLSFSVYLITSILPSIEGQTLPKFIIGGKIIKAKISRAITSNEAFS